MTQTYYPPAFRASAFHCPYCSVFSDQTWSAKVYFNTSSIPGQGMTFTTKDLYISLCTHCGDEAIWINNCLVFPDKGAAPIPNPDMPSDVLDDYLEATLILPKSPRGAAALLRLAVEKLADYLVKYEENENDIPKNRIVKLNEKIGKLVQEGLPVKIQKALDIVRVVGNNAVHPGQLDLKDDDITCTKLFKLINLIVQDRITEPKEIDDLYDTKISEGEKKQIEKRDKNI